MNFAVQAFSVVLGSVLLTSNLADTGLAEPVVPDPRVAELSLFLQEKESPFPAEVLLKYDNWPMIVAVAGAESGYGKHLAGTNNAWGIKYFGRNTETNRYGRYRNFESWDEAIGYTSELLYKYDKTDGQPAPRAMVARWKYVKPFDGWLRNVNHSLYSLKEGVSFAEEAIKV